MTWFDRAYIVAIALLAAVVHALARAHGHPRPPDRARRPTSLMRGNCQVRSGFTDSPRRVALSASEESTGPTITHSAPAAP